jgi:hypothetical protein
MQLSKKKKETSPCTNGLVFFSICSETSPRVATRALHRNTSDDDHDGALKGGSARRPSWSDSLPPKHAAGSTCDQFAPRRRRRRKVSVSSTKQGMKTSTRIRSFSLMRRKACARRERAHHGKPRNHPIGPQCTTVLLPPLTVPSCQSPPACPSTSLRCPPK